MGSAAIEVWRWIGSTPEIERYPLVEIDRAIGRLNGDVPSDLTIARHDGSSITAGGNGGRYVMIFTPDDGVENWHAETCSAQVTEDVSYLVVGGQGADYPPAVRMTIDEVRQATTWFLRNGGMCPSLTWVQD